MQKSFRLFCVGLALCMFAFTSVSCGTVKVTDVALDQTAASVAVDAGFLLKASITPENAKNKSVSWTSDKPDVASVSGTGWVEGKATGIAQITVTTDDGAFTATCTVTVTPATGKTKAQVKAAFEAAGYAEEYNFDASTAFFPAYTYTKGTDSFVAIFCTNAAIATEVKPAFDEKAQANGLTCRQDGRILYYGAAAAVSIFEMIPTAW